jgi:hypothetical protein
MSDEFDLGAGLDVLDAMRKRITGVRAQADAALADLGGRLGDDEALGALAAACAEYHFATVKLFDAITASGLRRGNWKPAD